MQKARWRAGFCECRAGSPDADADDVMDSIHRSDEIGNPEIGDLERRLEDLSRRLEEQGRALEALPEITAEAVRQTPPEPLMDVPALAAYMAVSVRQVERLIADGEIVPLWIGGVRRFSRETVRAYLRAAAKPRRKARRAAR